MKAVPWDDQLRVGRKSLRTRPDKLLLGSTGARLWADYVDPMPGFAGRFDFIHKVNIPLLFSVDNNLSESFEPCRTEWFPSHLRMEFEGSRLSFQDYKFITWDDCAVSCQTWTNHSSENLVLQLTTYGNAFRNRDGKALVGGFEIEHYSFDIDAVLAVSDMDLLEQAVLRPGESKSFIAAVALGIRGKDDPDQLKRRAEFYTDTGDSVNLIVDAHRESYNRWFDKAPTFQSSDPLLDKTWVYRWFLLRHNLADPQYGLLPHPLFYEGRSHKKSKTPFGKGGWEFSKLINLSVPLHIMDARWYHDPVYCEGSLKNMKDAAEENEQFCCLMVDQKLHSFANFTCWAAYQLYMVHRNKAVLSEMLPSLKIQISEWQRLHGNERDQLMIEYRHTRTGKEYQPSYWYFHHYPKNPKDPETYTHLKRVDRSIYHYLNVLGVARLCDELGDPDAESFHALAESIGKDVLEKMWDESTGFFYDLHYQTDEKAYVKNIVGFYPAWAQITDHRFDRLIHHLMDENEFNTGSPFPSVAADCPAYAREGGWMGHFIKGRNGCVWDGPTWPYTNSVALDALAKESKRRDHQFDRHFARFLREYSFLHFFNRDLNQPGLVEHYNSSTGEPISDEQEYNHSFYIDLIITHVAGLSVEKDRLVLDPLDVGLDYFVLDNIQASGLNLRITYCKPEAAGRRPELGQGYRLYVDGKQVIAGDQLCRMEWPLPQR